ncbi:cellulase family glycosylhydrolase [Dyadobacter sp. 32]|uniref:cellulase family glycosylhydrolase n=1 Tax=Dyadobacter sp. 32 TaxID=538966 RepID=UPI0039C5EB2C
MRQPVLGLFLVFAFLTMCHSRLCARQFGGTGDSSEHFVRISADNSQYLELDNGKLFIPVGINICWPRFVSSEDSIMAKMEYYLRNLGKNGGNFTRIWLSAPAFEIEIKQAGHYDEVMAKRIDRLVAIAKENRIRIKFCLENFRNLTNMPPMFAGSVPFDKPVYDQSKGGALSGIDDFFTTQKGKDYYLRRVEFLAERYANNPTVFGWELWNEVNSVRTSDKQILFDWTRDMLPEVKKRFPRQLVMQSLGSFDSESATGLYRDYSQLKDNELAQVHRYLDPGAKLEVSRGPMDKLAHDAVTTLMGFNLNKPIVLSEVGAVEAHHAGPSKLYEKDTAGMMLHDYLFAPFFAGGAGPGQSWHWDYYIDKHNLWYQLARFNQAIQGLDPRSEDFQPFVYQEDKVKVYGLKGKNTILIWVKDRDNTWHSELVKGIKPEVLSGILLKLPFEINTGQITFYDPWKDKNVSLSATDKTIALPEFERSGIVRITLKK